MALGRQGLLPLRSLQGLQHLPPSLLLRYFLETDRAAWLAIDPESGIVTTRAGLDRESYLVKDNAYEAVVLAVDNGRAGGGLLPFAGEGIKSLIVGQS